MDSEYPPLPPSRGRTSSIQTSHRRKPTTPPSASSEEHQPSEKKDSQLAHGEHRHATDLRQSVNVISIDGDVIIEYADPDGLSPVSSVSGHRWLVASEDLTRNSPYFRALLDPNKFSEGRQFMQQKTDWNQKSAAAGQSEATNENAAANRPPSLFSRIVDDGASIHGLPKLSLPMDQFIRRLGVDAIELFLRLLSSQSLDDDDEKKQGFEAELKILPPSLIARLVEIADAFNSPQVAREALRRCGYVYGKGRVSVSKFNQSLLKMSEVRIRQIIYIAHFLRDSSAFQISTHALLVAGSKYWVNGVEAPSTADSTFRWLYFTDGLEGNPNKKPTSCYTY